MNNTQCFFCDAGHYEHEYPPSNYADTPEETLATQAEKLSFNENGDRL